MFSKQFLVVFSLVIFLFGFICGTSGQLTTLSITADSDVLELYVDGERYNVDRAGWDVTRMVPIPVHPASLLSVVLTQEYGLQCFFVPVVAGLLASTSDDRLVTDRSWKCTTQPNSHHWMTLSYSDASWPTAVVAAAHSAADLHGIRRNISSRASWIWTSRNGYGGTGIDSQVYCRVTLPYNQNQPRSCHDIKNTNGSLAPSGEYSIWVPRLAAYIQVYCEMGLNGGGYTFINPVHLPRLLDSDIQSMFAERTSFLLRTRLTDGSQSYGLLQQLPQYQTSQLKVYLNNHVGYTRPQNVDYLSTPYLFFGFVPSSYAEVMRSTQGFLVNGNSVTFTNNDGAANSYIALFPNFQESSPTSYHLSSTYPLTARFVQLLRPVYSRRVMPAEYFTFMEMRFGGSSGIYSQTDWRPGLTGILSASIGFR